MGWRREVEGKNEYLNFRNMLMAEVSGARVRGRPMLGQMCGVKVALDSPEMAVGAARQWAKDRKDLVLM